MCVRLISLAAISLESVLPNELQRGKEGGPLQVTGESEMFPFHYAGLLLPDALLFFHMSRFKHWVQLPVFVQSIVWLFPLCSFSILGCAAK